MAARVQLAGETKPEPANRLLNPRQQHRTRGDAAVTAPAAKGEENGRFAAAGNISINDDAFMRSGTVLF